MLDLILLFIPYCLNDPTNLFLSPSFFEDQEFFFAFFFSNILFEISLDSIEIFTFIGHLKYLLSWSIKYSIDFVLVTDFLLPTMIEGFLNDASRFSWNSNFFTILKETKSDTSWLASFRIDQRHIRDMNRLNFFVNCTFSFVLCTTSHSLQLNVDSFNENLVHFSVNTNNCTCFSSVLTRNSNNLITTDDSPSVKRNLLFSNEISFFVSRCSWLRKCLRGRQSSQWRSWCSQNSLERTCNWVQCPFWEWIYESKHIYLRARQVKNVLKKIS